MKLKMLAMVMALSITSVGCTNGDAAMNYSDLLASNSRVIPSFNEVETHYNHLINNASEEHEVLDLISFQPFSDGRNAVMITGGKNQHNAVLIYDPSTKEMIDIAKDLGLEGELNNAKYGLAAGDLTGDGKINIVLAQENGIFLYTQDEETNVFTKKNLDIQLPENAIAVGVELADIDNNGLLDIYLSTFIKKTLLTTANFTDPKERVDNVLLKNMGNGVFVDKSEESNLNIHQNTFLSKFVDLNNNGYLDLIPALNTSQAKVYENNKDGTFTEHTLTEGYGFWMGVATADVSNTGYQDILLTNVGSSIPSFLLKGDLEKSEQIDPSYYLFRHNGDFNFKDVSKEVGLNLTKFGWGAEFINLSNDGLNDLYITENYTHYPFNLQKYFPSNGTLLLQNADGKYTKAQNELKVKNPYFGYRVLGVDVTNNGKKDLIIGNLNGPIRVFENID